MSEAQKPTEPQSQAEAEHTDASPQVKKTPGKRPRLSFIERAQKESEELVKTLGGSLEMEGGRRTRSSARGTPTQPVATPPPAKKTRNSPASPKTTTPRGRGRGRKLDTSVTPEPPEPKAAEQPAAEKVEENEAAAAEKEAAEPEKSVEAAEKPAEQVQTNESSATNGPEEVEKVNDVPAKTAQSSAETIVEAQPPAEKPAVAVEASKPTDQVDATLPQETVTEKTSQPATQQAAVEIVTENPSTPAAAEKAADSPMEVDEQSNPPVASSKTNEETVAAVVPVPAVAVAAAAAAVPTAAIDPPVVVEKSEVAAVVQPVVEKQPTPEPMEIDSSSKSSDVIECTDVVDKVEETSAATVQNSSNDIESTNSHAVVVESKPTEVPAIPATENNLKGEINANVTANDIPAVKSIEEPVAVGEPHVDNNKNENDVDKQKLAAAASQLNAASGGGDAPINTAVPTSL